MKIERILDEMIHNENDGEKRFILSILKKFSIHLKPVEEKTDIHPLLYVRPDKMFLIYKDDDIDGFHYTFSQYEELTIVLQQIFAQNKNLYVYIEKTIVEKEFKESKKTISMERIMKKIDEAIDKNDQESFIHYSTMANRHFH